MALYTGFLAVNYTDNVFTRVYFVDTESNLTNLSVDMSPYVQEEGGAINVLDSILELFTLYPYIGKIGFQTVGTTSVNYDTANLITAGTEIFRNEAEFDANYNDELYTIDFSPVVTPPITGTVDLTPILSAIALLSSKIDLIETKVNTLSNTDLSFTNTQISQIQSSVANIPIAPINYNQINDDISGIVSGNFSNFVINNFSSAITQQRDEINAFSSALFGTTKADILAIKSKTDTLDLTNVLSSLETIKGYTDTLEASFTNMGTMQIRDINSLVFGASLNGNYYTFKDGASVLTFPDNREYTVIGSYFVYSGEATQTILYQLIDSDNKLITAPHTFLTLKV